MDIDTKIIPQFLSDEELDILENHFLKTEDIHQNYNPGNFGGEVFSGTYYIIRYYEEKNKICLLYTSPSPRDLSTSRMPSSA